MSVEKDIKDSLKEKKIVLGTRGVIRSSKQGVLKMIVISSNVPEKFRRDLERYASLSQTELQSFPGNSIELAQLCRKPFKILTVGIKK